ncbi:DMT family transporter [Brevifollis gellanilyticus]|uniref:MFS transporter n=1 Tax=Brevifollis gellanilyticus TaxID=748831 RepID=A0A512MFF4_9BACT|nr:DMT family transporter [Brevifollis gellanilyticus]GEP45442.1 MFS transporter [Brevifollis gellanilyticus]
MTRARANLVLLSCALVWGLAFLFQKQAMGHVGPFLFIASRSLLASLALWPLAWREKRKAEASGNAAGRRQGLVRLSMISGVVFFAAAALQQAGLITTTVTNSSFLTALYVVITPFLTWLIMRQKPGPVVWMAVVLSFVGTWLLGGGSLSAFTIGDVYMTIGAVLWALHVVLVALAAQHERAATFSAIQFATVTALAALMAVSMEPLNWSALGLTVPAILYCGLISSAVTFTVLAIALRHTRPSEAAVILSTESIFAAVAAYFWLGERLPHIGWVGAGIIFVATLVVNLPSRTKLSQT